MVKLSILVLIALAAILLNVQALKYSSKHQQEEETTC